MKTFNLLATYFTLGSFLLMTACSSSAQVTDWRQLPNDQKIRVVTKSGAELNFDSWTVEGDSSFIGLKDSTTRIIPTDSIQVAYAASSTSSLKYAAIFAGAYLGGILLIILIMSLTYPLRQ